MPLWRAASIESEPEIELVNLLIMKVKSGLWPDETLHFVGYSLSGREGRVSSRIVEFDRERMVGMTRSGRVYRLEGPAGNGSSDGRYVWGYWCLRNEVTESITYTI
jgi:hypothetical protein